MKTIIFFLAFMLVAGSVFAVDTIVGNYELTDKQLMNLSDLKDGTILGVSYRADGNAIVAVSLSPLSQGKINQVFQDAVALPDAEPQSSIDKKQKKKDSYDKVKQKLALTDEEMNIMGFYE